MLKRLLTIGVISLLTVFANRGGATAVYDVNLGAVSDSLLGIGPNYSLQSEVNNLEIIKGGVKFTLKSGTLTLANNVLGRTIAATFVGKGNIQAYPPTAGERYMLMRLCKDTIVNWDFSEATFFATDSTFEDLTNKLTFSNLNKPGKEKQLLKWYVDYQQDHFYASFGPEVLGELRQPSFAGSFAAGFKSKFGNTFFYYDPRYYENVKVVNDASSGDLLAPDEVLSYRAPGKSADDDTPIPRDNREIDSLEYNIYCKIWQSASCDFEVAVSFISNFDGLAVVPFDIYHDLVGTSIHVTNEAGDSLYWNKLKDESHITVYFEKPLMKGERKTLKFAYSSKGMMYKTPWGNNILRNSTDWYPNYGYLKRAKYKLKFACPKQYTFLSVGQKTSEKIEDDFKITEWDISNHPVALVSFNYGVFDEDTGSTAQGIPIEVYGSTGHGGGSKGMLDAVLNDIKGSASLFSAELAPYPFEKLTVTEIPSEHGQGMPGFIHLAWSTFQGQTTGYDDLFRAHEVAHQWWGHLVGWKSYHDQWLSEAFAEYSGAWYVQRKYANDPKNKGKFYEMMDRWRENVMEKGGGLGGGYSAGNESGSIWMGTRLITSESEDYTTLVYSKGAYILYMLKMLMFDYVKKDDSKFTAVLSNFCKDYAWKDASTEDFKGVVEKSYGSSLDWFFNEWVYGTDLPSYTWKTTTTQKPNGKYEVTVDVTTEGVSPEFRMPVPMAIVMEGDYHTVTVLDINSAKKEIVIPNLPYKPVRFVFNAYKAVLCKDTQL